MSLVEPAQYCVGCVGSVELVESPANAVPPIDVEYGMLEGKSTDKP